MESTENMKDLGTLYLDQSKSGESRWWSWCVGLWFTIVGALFWQSVLVTPIPDISGAKNPEALKAYEDASANFLASIDMVTFGVLVGLLLLVSVLVGIFWIFNRALKGKARSVFGVLTGLMMATSVYLFAKLLPMMSSEEFNAAFNTLLGISALSYMLMLLTFPAVLIVLYIVQKFLHHRPILSLHTAATSFRWKRVLQVIGITFVVYAVLTFISHFSGLSPVEFVFDPSRFFAFALVSLLFIPLQAATEEILIRGYMNQGLVSVFKNKWIAFTLSSLAFMSLHLANPEATKAASESPTIFIMTMSSYFIFGFLLSIMVDFEGGLEAAIGVHAANNLFAAIFVNYENSVLPTPSIFLAKMNVSVDLPVGMAVLAFVTYLVYRTRKPIDGVTLDSTPPSH